MMTPFNDLLSPNCELQDEIDAAALRVLHSGWYILGREVSAFEAAFAAYHDIDHAVGVASGTDAIELALRAAGVGRGDEVITVSLTAVPTVCAIERAGAIPVLVDVDADTYTMDPSAARAAITPLTRAILPVHLYGQPADMVTLGAIAREEALVLVEDCAQAHGARLNGRLVGTFGDLAAFSFYPTKNLGAVGDGGAVITNDSRFAENLRRLRNYGQVSRYANDTRGVNSRLDELQAAVLSGNCWAESAGGRGAGLSPLCCAYRRARRFDAAAGRPRGANVDPLPRARPSAGGLRRFGLSTRRSESDGANLRRDSVAADARWAARRSSGDGRGDADRVP
jgi:dTDP-3-amino-3,4,6-trideoxy-alpha-D-glucose transaminase